MKRLPFGFKTLLQIILIILFSSPSFAKDVITHRVDHVIDGDTVVLKNGDHVRYLGIDTPEKDEPFYTEARLRNKELVIGKEVKLFICKEEPRDKYGRVLAWVYSNGTFVNRTLLKEGLAKALIIPPCGLERKQEFLKIESETRAKGIGIWNLHKGKSPPIIATISPDDALSYEGRVVAVKDVVTDVHKSRKALFINLGGDRKTGFTAVLFKQGMDDLKAEGIDPFSYKGKNISVTGVVRKYGQKAEIIVKRASQIIVE